MKLENLLATLCRRRCESSSCGDMPKKNKKKGSAAGGGGADGGGAGGTAVKAAATVKAVAVADAGKSAEDKRHYRSEEGE